MRSEKLDKKYFKWFQINDNINYILYQIKTYQDFLSKVRILEILNALTKLWIELLFIFVDYFCRVFTDTWNNFF